MVCEFVCEPEPVKPSMVLLNGTSCPFGQCHQCSIEGTYKYDKSALIIPSMVLQLIQRQQMGFGKGLGVTRVKPRNQASKI